MAEIRRCEKGGGGTSPGDLTVTDGTVQEEDEKKKNWKKMWWDWTTELFFLLRLELLIKQQTNKQKKAATTNRFLYTYYIHIYIRKEALVAFTVLDKWGLKLEDQEKQWKKKKLYIYWQTFFLFPLFLLLSHCLSASAELWLLEVTEVSISNNRTANLSPLRDQRTKHFYCSEQ